ncbi:MAG: hypothetical protein V3U29_10375 [Phycisphaeraceae bacterium]
MNPGRVLNYKLCGHFSEPARVGPARGDTGRLAGVAPTHEIEL